MRIAVTGASGRIGGEVVRLLAAQQRQVVALTRRPPAAGRWPAGVAARQAGYADEQALAAALDGVGTLVLVSSDGPVADVIVHHRNVIRAAARRGVAHIVALSGLDAGLDSPFCYAVGYGYTEQLLAESGCAVSLARASIYTEFFLSFLTRARASGQLRLPAADGRVSFVSRDDVARSLAALATARPPPGRRRSPAPRPWTWPPSPPWPRRSGPPRSGTPRLPRPSSSRTWPPTARTRGGSTPTPRCSPRSATSAGPRSPPTPSN